MISQIQPGYSYLCTGSDPVHQLLLPYVLVLSLKGLAIIKHPWLKPRGLLYPTKQSFAGASLLPRSSMWLELQEVGRDWGPIERGFSMGIGRGGSTSSPKNA